MLIFAAIVATFIYGMIAAMLGTILPDLSNRFQLTPRQNGIIAFAQALGLIIASLAVGPLLDNEGKKAGLMLGLAFISFALFALPRSSGFRSIVLLLFFLGVGGGIVVTGANALISDVGETHRAIALNMVNLFFGLGGLATPFISAHLFARNWVRLCYTVAFLTVITFGIQAVTKMPPPTGCRASSSRRMQDPFPGASTALSFGFLPVSVHYLRGWRLELADTPPDCAGHPGIERAEHSFARFCPGPADRPGGCFPNSRPRVIDHRASGGIYHHGRYNLPHAPYHKAWSCVRAGFPRRTFHGSGLSYHVGYRR